MVVYRRERERDKRERGVLLRESVFSVRTFERDERRRRVRKGSPRFGLLSVHLGIGIISLSLRDDDDDDDFFEQQRCDDDENANECENQRRYFTHFFYHRKQQREKRRKDEDDEKRVLVFFVFVARTTIRFSHRTEEGVY